MVFSKKGAAAGLAVCLLLLTGALVSPAAAGLISETEADAPHWGWASIYGEDGDDDVATVLLWGFGIALLWPNGHEAVIPPPDPPPPTDPPSGGGGGKTPEACTWAFFALGALKLLALRRRQK
ncbi:MAG: hypothetical protein UT11_C0069G0003 [Berkelbacteria bacterium GW2011_GWA2_38_9]|uniref:Uncharacterized protein n=1 Tax=Berkelbacteria bacterium GW2011_GWA2_38_9 TaxID=1618334 RepID=A0A0G0LEY7_9BACT|nr:MAG: hypothetical protein UT11_C0069G0003 [Berkelbacteria bacterium GW2011_GWA2_38_9]